MCRLRLDAGGCYGDRVDHPCAGEVTFLASAVLVHPDSAVYFWKWWLVSHGRLNPVFHQGLLRARTHRSSLANRMFSGNFYIIALKHLIKFLRHVSPPSRIEEVPPQPEAPWDCDTTSPCELGVNTGSEARQCLPVPWGGEGHSIGVSLLIKTGDWVGGLFKALEKVEVGSDMLA